MVFAVAEEEEGVGRKQVREEGGELLQEQGQEEGEGTSEVSSLLGVERVEGSCLAVLCRMDAVTVAEEVVDVVVVPERRVGGVAEAVERDGEGEEEREEGEPGEEERVG